MSTIKEKIAYCVACGQPSEQTWLVSFSTFSGPDLDFRPAQLLRSTMKHWIMICPHCGYVAENISKWPRPACKVLERLYATADIGLPQLGYQFQKRALHCEHQKDIRGAIRAYLCAVWVCDDAEDDVRAREMRAKCLELTQRKMRRCRKRDWNRYLLLKADLLRRMSFFEELATIDTSDKRMSEFTKAVIVCQQVLAQRGDVAAHCFDEFNLEME